MTHRNASNSLNVAQYLVIGAWRVVESDFVGAYSAKRGKRGIPSVNEDIAPMTLQHASIIPELLVLMPVGALVSSTKKIFQIHSQRQGRSESLPML